MQQRGIIEYHINMELVVKTDTGTRDYKGVIISGTATQKQVESRLFADALDDIFIDHKETMQSDAGSDEQWTDEDPEDEV